MFGKNAEIALFTGNDNLIDIACKQAALRRDKVKMEFVSDGGNLCVFRRCLAGLQALVEPCFHMAGMRANHLAGSHRYRA